ncbi:metallothionein [Nitrosococcus oceani]|uniref:Metallothionein, family 14 n=2 Tax=Nitrosococcus TaxID=1227 RepID=Q3J765_NITOC|nr:metallothionein [Nitrosococcus oceani]ABA59331.1 metallothionein, family 14 [Nitrosococcus oceani ATCC 19707]ADJ27176.1 metallothionein family 14 [Nitrosococcus watsonii C-113]
MNTDTQSSTMKCAHAPCSCVVTAEEGVKKDGQVYCSEACAREQGCEHGACACRNQQAG